jgi:NTE family protein
MKIGLTLSAGSALGISHIAFLKVFDEIGIKPSIISGSSIGGLLGAMYASGLTGKEIEKIFLNIDFRDMARIFDIAIRTDTGFVKGDYIIKRFNSLVRVKTFEELEIPLKIVATDFWNKKEVVFDRGNLAQAIRASISVPGIFKPVNIDGRMYVDGILVDPLPYEIIQKQCDRLVAIDVCSLRAKKSGNPKIFEIILGSFGIMHDSIVANKLKKSMPDIYVKPCISNVRLLDFRRTKDILSQVSDDAVEFKKNLIKLTS